MTVRIFRVPVLAILLLLFVLPIGAAGNPVRLEIVVPADAMLPQSALGDIIGRVMKRELDWCVSFDQSARETFTVELHDVTVNGVLFAPKQLVEISLTFHGNGRTLDRRLAFLVPPEASWEEVCAEALTGLARNGLWPLFEIPGETDVLDYALDSGYSALHADTRYQVGERIWVNDRDGNPLAMMEVANRFVRTDDGGSADVAELRPVWATRPIVEGMPLDPHAPEREATVSTALSIGRFGLDLGVNFPLPGTLFRFSLKAQADAVPAESAYEALVLAGVSTGASLGSFRSSSASVGSWWTNLYLSVSARLGAGVRGERGGPTAFLHGAEVELGIAYRSSARFFWGISVGYRQRVSSPSAAPLTVQAQERGLTLSPSVGWLW